MNLWHVAVLIVPLFWGGYFMGNRVRQPCPAQTSFTTMTACTLFDETMDKEAKKVAHRPLMVYIGSADVTQPGFISFTYAELDVTKQQDFEKYFCPGSVDVFFSEHTYEHIRAEKYAVSFQLMLKYLRPGGYVRLATPTFPPNHTPGPLDVEYGHVSFYTAEALRQELQGAGFEPVTILEQRLQGPGGGWIGFCSKWFDSCGGRVRRSFRHDNRNTDVLRTRGADLPHNAFNEIDDICINTTEELLLSTIVEAFAPSMLQLQ